VAQQPSRIPDLGGARPEALADRHLGNGDQALGEAGPGLGRRPDQPGAAATAGGLIGAGTAPLRSALEDALPERPFRVEFWDGSALPATGGGPTFSVRSPQALGHIIRSPGQLGVGRAYVVGALDVDSIDDALELLDTWNAPSIDLRAQARIAAAAVRAGALRSVPHVPDAELRPRGRRHSIARDRRAVRHHYDVSNEYFELFLGPSMTYSCAIFSRGATTLEEAQETKLELVCTKLGLEPDMRVLDVGCGWGSFAVHAATRHGAHVTAITLSEPQAALARQRAADAGVADKVEIRVQDYRELGGERWDRISSIGMVEHVGAVNIDEYCRILLDAVEPGGTILNHGIARLRHGDPEAGPFSERFVFPDAAPLHLSRICAAFEKTHATIDHVEGFPADYAETLRHWARRLDERLDDAVRLAGEERVRVWRLYLRAARRGFESGFTGIYQVRVRA
jgi:cyclopropane-fatty-acyl-phospholipid synthase